MSTTQTESHAGVHGKPNYWVAWEICCNVVLALYFFQFVLINGACLMTAFRISTLLLLLKVSSDTIFHLFRKPAKEISLNIYHWAIGIVGAFTNFFYRSVEGDDLWIGTGIQIVGIALQVFAMLSLNRSIGFVAANRGIKTNGMYRFVRHPLYFAYIVAFFGYLLNHFTLNNQIVFAFMVYCLYLRTHCEEEILSKDPEYCEYKSRVKYRIIPYVL